jgi:predicted O-methyltransferase YrrM
MFNENWYSDDQAIFLEKLVTQVNSVSGCVIEIGCWEGKSTAYIANACYPEKMICNDTWLGNIAESRLTGITHVTEIILKHRDVYSTFLSNMNSLTKGNYSVVKQDCIEWLTTYKTPIKFCHIDASHEYQSVYDTIKLIIPNLQRGGIICGDDFLNANISRTDLNGGVERAVRELLPGVTNYGNLWYYVNE